MNLKQSGDPNQEGQRMTVKSELLIREKKKTLQYHRLYHMLSVIYGTRSQYISSLPTTTMKKNTPIAWDP